MKKPLFVIVHEHNVPLDSPQYNEIARIKQEERWMHAPIDLNPSREEIEEPRLLYVCGAYSLHCVLAHLTKLREARGPLKGTLLHEPGTISAIEASDYI